MEKLTSHELIDILTEEQEDCSGNVQINLLKATSIYRKIDVSKIPPLHFKPEWEVRIIPPYGSAMMRFLVSYNGRNVSVYCDMFSFLGYYGAGEPYWEMYPRTFSNSQTLEDIMRFGLYDTDELIAEIDKELKGIPVNEGEVK